MGCEDNRYSYLNDIYNEIIIIGDELNCISIISSEIEIIRSRLLFSLPSDINLENNINQLNEKYSQLRTISLSIRSLLFQMKSKEKSLKGIKSRINQNHFKNLRDQYHSLLIQLNENNHLYRLLTKKRLDRQLNLLGRASSNDHLDEFIVVPDIMIDNQNQINLISNQSEQIHQMENTLKQLKDLFEDFNYFIQNQNQIINSIEDKIINTNIQIEEQFQISPKTKSNKFKLFIIILLIIAILFIIIISLTTFLNHQI